MSNYFDLNFQKMISFKCIKLTSNRGEKIFSGCVFHILSVPLRFTAGVKWIKNTFF